MMPMEMRQPPLGRMSPGPRDRSNRSYDSRSPSPQYRSPRYRGHSPAARSERRPSPPARHRAASPARSERYYRREDRREDRRSDRAERYSSSRDPSPYSTRSERSDRDRDRPGQTLVPH